MAWSSLLEVSAPGLFHQGCQPSPRLLIYSQHDPRDDEVGEEHLEGPSTLANTTWAGLPEPVHQDWPQATLLRPPWTTGLLSGCARGSRRGPFTPPRPLVGAPAFLTWELAEYSPKPQPVSAIWETIRYLLCWRRRCSSQPDSASSKSLSKKPRPRLTTRIASMKSNQTM